MTTAAPRRWWRLHDDGNGSTMTAATPRQWRRLHDDGDGSKPMIDGDGGGGMLCWKLDGYSS